MPTLSTFYGIIIKMYWDEHPQSYRHLTLILITTPNGGFSEIVDGA